jgi:hypothetical protein
MSKPAKPTPPPVEDPLADLRESEDIITEPETVHLNGDPEPVGFLRPMVDKATQDEMVAEAVAAFHADPTTMGFLHGGGQCGCRYVARVALQAAVPVMTEADLEERDLEPSNG